MKPSRRSSGDVSGESLRLDRTLSLIAVFFNECKVGYQGCEGYRKSSDLLKLGLCVQDLMSRGHIDPARTNFLDLGCADGRVNIMMSYFVRTSTGIEINPDFIDEYPVRQGALRVQLEKSGLILPPDNIVLLPGSSLDTAMNDRMEQETGICFEDVDLFYTYITLHDVFAEKIALEAGPGALYLVYGFSKVLPSYPGLELLLPDVGGQGIAALYRKEGA